MQACKIKHKQTGAMLILSLLFLSLLSLLVLVALQSSKLQFSMTKHYQDRARAFYAANNALVQAEKRLSVDLIEQEGEVKNGIYHIQLSQVRLCQQDYLIRTQGQIANAKVNISAEYSLPLAGCPGSKKLLWWREG